MFFREHRHLRLPRPRRDVPRNGSFFHRDNLEYHVSWLTLRFPWWAEPPGAYRCWRKQLSPGQFETFKNSEILKPSTFFKLCKILKCSKFENFSFFIVWTTFDLKFGLLANFHVECSAPGLKRRLGAEFPGDRFFRQHR